MNWEALIGGILAAFVGWLTYRAIRKNPDAFSKENFGKSAKTLGLLALFLMLVIFVALMIVRG